MKTATVSSKNDIDASVIYSLRQAGATLQQIADGVGRTRERVRQILNRNYRTTKRRLLSSEQLCRISGQPRNRIVRLYHYNIISPVREWTTGKKHHLLWPPDTVGEVVKYCQGHHTCKICHKPIPKGRWLYCSERCYHEGQKLQYRDKKAKQRRLVPV
jgi:predicted nucleic acid-binding Zn ribbon protein